MIDDDRALEEWLQLGTPPDRSPLLPAEVTISLSQAWKALKDGDLRTAEAASSRALSRSPDEPWLQGFHLWCQPTLHKRAASAAAVELRSITSAFPSLVMPKAWMSRLLLRSKDLKGAGAILESISPRDGDRPSILLATAEFEEARSRWVEAKTAVAEYVRVTHEPSRPILTWLMLLAANSGDEAAFRHAYASDPRQKVVSRSRGARSLRCEQGSSVGCWDSAGRSRSSSGWQSQPAPCGSPACCHGGRHLPLGDGHDYSFPWQGDLLCSPVAGSGRVAHPPFPMTPVAVWVYVAARAGACALPQTQPACQPSMP